MIRPIGRLDKDTSGAVLFARNQVAAARLWSDFQNQEQRLGAHKEYLALVWGSFLESGGSIEEPLERCQDALNRMRVSQTGQYAKTNYQMLQKFETEAGIFSLVRLTLETGRTHQIRVHMAYTGHPLLGDPIYGDGRLDANGSLKMTRAALHCHRMRLRQPFTGKWIQAEAPLPEDMGRLLAEADESWTAVWADR
ncbi:MAG: RluA family pseudouridine synthase [Lachnospiraceae bacterium]|nr:RluA family pseudouridine synthase [Lachnospiraceae bacterium]